jgi:hypothetical protein
VITFTKGEFRPRFIRLKKEDKTKYWQAKTNSQANCYKLRAQRLIINY